MSGSAISESTIQFLNNIERQIRLTQFGEDCKDYHFLNTSNVGSDGSGIQAAAVLF